MPSTTDSEASPHLDQVEAMTEVSSPSAASTPASGSRRLDVGSPAPPPSDHKDDHMRIASKSDPFAVAAAIKARLVEGRVVSMVVIGPQAVRVAVRAVAAADRYLDQHCIALHAVFFPEFTTVIMDPQRQATGLQFTVYAVSRPKSPERAP